MTGRRRTYTAVALCLALLAACAVAGVEWWSRRWEGSVTLLGNWTGGDEERFRRDVLAPFERKHRIRVVYQGSSAESQVLAADVASGTPPDVVVMPGPGELAEYAAQGRLEPLDGLFDPGHYDPVWAPELAGGVHWVPVKADLKSMVWHPGALPEAEVARIARDPGEWCLAMESGATSGWPGTDWVEDVLLQRAGRDTYQKWATGRLPWTHPAVRDAWTTWGDLVGAGDRRRTGRMLLAPYQDPWSGEDPACADQRLEHQAAFVRSGSHWTAAHGRYVHAGAVIPGARRDVTAWEVSGDLAAMLRDTPEARALIRHLADPGTAQLGFTANRAVPAGRYDADPMAARIDATLRGRGTMRCWDASDAMPPAMRDAFQRAALRFLTDPGELSAQLATLEEVRVRHRDAAWLPSVCGSGG
ncbi:MULTISPECIES: ABC transporter substrate-binding protein [Streptomyces]|uniref:ABC transporter substrate-binding protein n=1 Tax=Streptomyces sudanensis TaxID=436397 RepID=A0ABY4T7N9_9ACTN|nr:MULTISPECIES: ABC transporter substrate-binding protein [Streptomyces]URN15000.1 ABC transporter substrate-binding protein [Streptomyces sudanensis]